MAYVGDTSGNLDGAAAPQAEKEEEKV